MSVTREQIENELKRRAITAELERRQATPPVQAESPVAEPQPSLYDRLKRQVGRTARIGAEAVGALPLIPMDAGVAARNMYNDIQYLNRPPLSTGQNRQYELPSQTYQKGLDDMGLPRPEGMIEKGVDIAGQVVAGGIVVPSPAIAKQAPPAFKRTPFTRQSPVKQDMTRMAQSGSDDISLAKYKLDPKTGGTTVTQDKVSKEAIKQGFDKGFVASIKTASKADKKKAFEMITIMEKGKASKAFAGKYRPSDVAGRTLINRYETIAKANKTAGSRLTEIAKGLKGEVNHSSAVNKFIAALKEKGITITDDLKLVFQNSDLEGTTPDARKAQRILNDTFKRMRDTRTPNAYDVHRLKKFIDNQVTFGKSSLGEAGAAESMIKNLRHNLDKILDDQFPKYNEVNTIYAETKGAIDFLQDVAGKKMNLIGPNADKATGVLLRKLLTNYEKRVRLIDATDLLDEVSTKYAGYGQKLLKGEGLGKHDLNIQVMVFDELDRVFGPAATGSFQGQIKQGVESVARKNIKEHVVDIAAKGAEKALGVNEERAFDAIKKLLMQ